MMRLLGGLGVDMRIYSCESAEVGALVVVAKECTNDAVKCSLVNEFWYGWRSDRELCQSLPRLTTALRFLRDDGELDFDDDDSIDEGLFLLYMKPIVSYSVHDRLVLFNSMLHGCHELGPCLDIIEPALVDPRYFTTEIEIWHRPYLLHLLAQAFGKNYNTEEATHTGRVDALLQAGAAFSNLHKLDQLGHGMTPLMHVVFSTNRCYQHFEVNYDEQRWELKPLEKRLQHLRRALRQWLMILQSFGVNLYKYGKVEERCFRKNWQHNQKILWDFCFSLVEILGVKYSSKSSEWDFWTVNSNDAHLEEFWRMIEDPVPVPPGAWVEDCLPHPDPNLARLWRKPLIQFDSVRAISARYTK